MTGVTTAFSSLLAPVFAQYVDLKRALGRRFDNETRTVQSLDRFLQDQANTYPDLSAAAFQAWCQTQEKVASGVRRHRMLVVYNFCLYRRRTEPQCFVPDPALFPKLHQRLRPYIFSELEVARLLRAVSKLNRVSSSPLRPEVIRLAIVLLFATGIRRRAQRKLPVSSDTALIWNARRGGRAYTGTGLQCCLRPLLQQCSIFTAKGRVPRIHDFRHGFAVNALLRWYREGADVEAKLPLLATYLGHGSALSTHYYLHWIEPLRTAASERFGRHYGELVVPVPGRKGGQR